MSPGPRSHWAASGRAWFQKRLACLALPALGLTSSLQGQLFFSDNFNDGNDTSPAWIRYDPIGSHPQIPDQAVYTFPNGGYRIQTPPSPLPTQVGPGRAGSFRPEVYTDFYVAVDVVNWDDTKDQAIGILARCTQIGLGQTDGYAMTYQVPDHDIDITRFVNEDTSPEAGGLSIPLDAEDAVTLVPGHSYRFTFSGRGPTLTARVYELPDTVHPIMSASGTDATFPGGQCGLLVFDNTSAANDTADATFDNYYATDIEPPLLRIEELFPGLNFGYYRLSWPLDRPQFVLERSSVLPGTATDWQTVTGVTQDLNTGMFIFDIDTTLDGPRNFYRLVRRP